AVEGRGFVAFEPKHRGEIGKVSLSGERHGAVQLDLRLCRLVEELLVSELFQKPLGRDHGTESVGAGWPDPNLVDIENADCQATSPLQCIPGLRRANSPM